MVSGLVSALAEAIIAVEALVTIIDYVDSWQGYKRMASEKKQELGQPNLAESFMQMPLAFYSVLTRKGDDIIRNNGALKYFPHDFQHNNS